MSLPLGLFQHSSKLAVGSFSQGIHIESASMVRESPGKCYCELIVAVWIRNQNPVNVTRGFNNQAMEICVCVGGGDRVCVLCRVCAYVPSVSAHVYARLPVCV